MSAVDRSAASDRVVKAQESKVERIDSPDDTSVNSHDSILMDTSILRCGVDDLNVSPTSFFAGSERLSGGNDASIGEREEDRYSVRSDVLMLLVDSGGDDLIRSGVLRFGTALLVNKLLSKKLELSWEMKFVL